MGNVSNGFLDGFSGRLGNVVGYCWRGRWCVRSMPSHYNDARTPRQLSQRTLFKEVVRFAARARRVLKVGLRIVSIDAQMTESNYFMRINRRCFSLDPAGVQASRLQNDVAHQEESASDAFVYPVALSVDYESLILADGPVAPVAFGVPRMVDETTIGIDFEKNPLRRVVKSEDLVYLVAYCPELGDFDLSAPVYRRSNRLTMSLNEYWNGREVHLWGFVVDGEGRASQSQYIGKIIVGQADEMTDSEAPENSCDSLTMRSIPVFYAVGKVDADLPLSSLCGDDDGGYT